MDELVKLVSQKAGITEDQARTAITQVLAYLKQRLPAPIASQVDAVMSGGGLGDISKKVGGLFG